MPSEPLVTHPRPKSKMEVDETPRAFRQSSCSEKGGESAEIAEQPKHRTNLARIWVAIPGQLRAVEKLLDFKVMWLLILLMWAQRCRTMRDMDRGLVLPLWPRHWPPSIDQIRKP